MSFNPTDHEEMLNELLNQINEIDTSVIDNIKNSNTSIAAGQKIKYEVSDDDNALVAELKREINDADIDVKYIINKLNCNSRDAYHMFYGLRKRNSLSMSTLEKWCKVLDKKIVVKFE